MLWATQLAGTSTTIGSSTSTSNPVSVTPSATANTKGAWAELVASTPADCNSVMLGVQSALFSSGNNSFLLDVGVGGSGSETAIVSGLSLYNNGPVSFTMPLYLPAGVRVSVRAQANNTASVVLNIFAVLNRAQGLPVLARATDYGTLTASSGGTTLFTGTLATHTKSSWTEIVASTTNPLRFLFGMVNGPNVNGSTLTSRNSLVDIGVGSSGNEIVVMANISNRPSNTEYRTFPGGIWYDIPAGSRIAARWQSSVANPAQAPRVNVIGFG